MVSGAKCVGIDGILKAMEKELGNAKVTRVVNKSLKALSKEIEPKFREQIAIYKDTGETVESIVVSGIGREEGIPSIKLGFGAGSRWRLVHLNELGYVKNRNPRGLGVIRRFSAGLEETYLEQMRAKLQEGFKL